MDNLNIIAATIMRPHGLRGALKVVVKIDSWEKLYNYCYIEEYQYKISRISVLNRKNYEFIIFLEEINNIEDARLLLGKNILIAKKHLYSLLEKNEIFFFELVNQPLFSGNKIIGRVSGVFNCGGGDNIKIILEDNNHISFPLHEEYIVIKQSDETNSLKDTSRQFKLILTPLGEKTIKMFRKDDKNL